MTADTPAPVLILERLHVGFPSDAGELTAVHDLNLAIHAGECLGVVGESGAGKSQTFMAVAGLLPRSARISGSARLGGTELIGLARARLDRIRGVELGMIFQDPMTALTPHMSIGDQIAESLVRHAQLSWNRARERARELLASVHIADGEQRMRQFPHELSGGMRQRVMVAIALALNPRLLIADEPTTALDVTIQAQILALLAELKRSSHMTLVLISHDLGVIAGLADRVAVMYAGRIVELAPVDRLFRAPQHPYTRALLDSMPRLDAAAAQRLYAIPGQPPDPRARQVGCAFAPRCERADDRCRRERPELAPGDRAGAACHHPLGAGEPAAGRAAARP